MDAPSDYDTGRPGAEPLAQIARLETVLAAKLADRRLSRIDPGWIAHAETWSQAVWKAATELGPAPLTPSMAAWGSAVARRPVFICGAHRSGTTLLRDLLDGHPALAVLPSEGSYFTHLEGKLAPLGPDERGALLGREWLRRLVNPINQPPYWLLGRSGEDASPYVAFAREWLAWSASPPSPSRSWPLAALAIAWGRTCAGNGPPRFTQWVEKTPGNEFHLRRIWRDFPAARILHVVREPAAVAASHAALIRHAPPHAHPLAGALRDLARSCGVALRMARTAPADRYRIVRYEHLVADREAAMRGIAAFLDIEPGQCLFEPSVAGIPATPNTSFPDGTPAAPPSLGPRARWRLALAERRHARLPA